MAKSSGAAPILITGIIVLLILVFIGIWFSAHPGLFDKLWVMVLHNPIFWLTSSLGVFGAAYAYKRDPESFTIGEALVQVGFTISISIAFFSIFSFWFSDVQDTEYWNSRVIMSEYWEGWTGESKDSDGDRTTEYHSPNWVIHTGANESVSISQANYREIVKLFGKEKFERIYRSSRVSTGDGNRYYTVFPGTKETEITSSVEHYFVNWVKATKKKNTRLEALKEDFKIFLRPYPKLQSSRYGPIKLNRVIRAVCQVPKVFCQHVDKELSLLLATIGSSKQINILVYFVGTDNIEFELALKDHWVNGKKNDVIVIIGLNGSDITWSRVLAWVDDSSQFRTKLANRIEQLKTIDIDPEMLVKEIKEQVLTPPKKGGYKRKSMSEFNHLASEAAVPWWGNLVMFLTAALAMLATGVAFQKGSITS
jgi:hypothetical protein